LPCRPSDEHLPHLFERFYRIDPARSRALGGSGIGLTIAKALVEAHDGRIWAASAGPGHGATFSFTLPIADQNDVRHDPTASSS
jgi:two-component system, OmpR family, sensor histidine kinase BaeS